MKDFHLKLDSITDIIVLESMREELASNAHSIDVTWHERNFIYEKIQAIVCRLMNLERI
ncbi:hypothetical protein [Brevibacillus reuszeri]|uniref:hypothetical protein n=1 Tax=Brevibacillus reuszeri TaxID=54915 RepID=UPI0013E0603F|nr:hypothetical protein [Brevibacillus reuszeri]